jgi:hypothetical protein
MAAPVVAETADTAILTALIAVAGELHAVKMGLYVNAFTPTPASPLSSFTQPTYPGYALQSIVWGPVSRNPAGLISSTSGILPFQMSDATLPTTVIGVIIVDTAGAVLILSAAFPTPLTLVDALSVINAAFEYIQTTPNQGNLIVVE